MIPTQKEKGMECLSKRPHHDDDDRRKIKRSMKH